MGDSGEEFGMEKKVLSMAEERLRETINGWSYRYEVNSAVAENFLQMCDSIDYSGEVPRVTAVWLENDFDAGVCIAHIILGMIEVPTDEKAGLILTNCMSKVDGIQFKYVDVDQFEMAVTMNNMWHRIDG